MQREMRTKKELKGASECIAQEIKSIRRTVEVYEQYRSHGGYPIVTTNALFISFTIHYRKVLDFMYSGQTEKHPPFKSDVIAEDFFESPIEWHQLVPGCPPRAVSNKRRLNRQIAHLTFESIGSNTDAKLWHFDHMLDDLSPAIEAFYKIVDPDYRAEMYQEFTHSFWWGRVTVPFSAKDHAARIFRVEIRTKGKLK